MAVAGADTVIMEAQSSDVQIQGLKVESSRRYSTELKRQILT